MPEEQKPPEPQSLTSEPVKEVEIKPKKISKLPLILGGVVVLALLIAAGLYIAGQNSPKENSKDSNNEATGSSQQNTDPGTKTQTINKVGYIDKNNIWVLDVVSKSKTQITKDATANQSGTYYQSPMFVDSSNFVFVKVTKAGSELWRGKFDGGKFSIEQDKTFKSQITLSDISSDGKKILFSNNANNKVRFHLFDLTNDKDTIFYEKAEVGRGASQDDAFRARFSPDSSKILLADTIYTQTEQITVWDSAAKKIAMLSGQVTLPDWVGNNSFVYKETGVGIHLYNLTTKKSEKLNSEKDWSGIAVSEDGKKFAHNKGLTTNESGMSDSSIGLFDLSKKTDSSLGNSLAFPNWVNDIYLIANKVKKCTADECAIPDAYTTDKGIIVINATNGQKYEVQTEETPSFRF